MKKVLISLFVVTSSINASLLQNKQVSIGFDFGTSGVRCCCIDKRENIVHEDAILWSNLNSLERSASSPVSWTAGLYALMDKVPKSVKDDTKRVCISGTSGSALVFDNERLEISRDPRMYDYNVVSSTDFGQDVMIRLASVCPKGSPANAPTSPLAKLLCWNREAPLSTHEKLAHQADFLASELVFAADKPRNFKSDWVSC